MGRPVLRGQVWVAKFDLSPMGLQCACAGGGLLRTEHAHKPSRGSVKLAGGSWTSLARYTGGYTREMSEAYAQCLKQAL